MRHPGSVSGQEVERTESEIDKIHVQITRASYQKGYQMLGNGLLSSWTFGRVSGVGLFCAWEKDGGRGRANQRLGGTGESRCSNGHANNHLLRAGDLFYRQGVSHTHKRGAEGMGAKDKEEVLVTLSGGGPWGFRLQGGSEQNRPLQVSKVRLSSSLERTQILGKQMGICLLHSKPFIFRTPNSLSWSLNICVCCMCKLF